MCTSEFHSALVGATEVYVPSFSIPIECWRRRLRGGAALQQALIPAL